MALAMFNTPFPLMGRRLAHPAASWDTGFHSVFGDFDRHFAETEQRMNQMRDQLDIEAQEGAQGHSYSFSSSTYRSGDAAPVTKSSEEYCSGGKSMKRTVRSVGDQMIEETVRGNETSRTLTNLNEDELAQFEERVRTARHPKWLETRKPELEAPRAPPFSPQADLPAALEQDIQRLQQ